MNPSHQISLYMICFWVSVLTLRHVVLQWITFSHEIGCSWENNSLRLSVVNENTGIITQGCQILSYIVIIINTVFICFTCQTPSQPLSPCCLGRYRTRFCGRKNCGRWKCLLHMAKRMRLNETGCHQVKEPVASEGRTQYGI